MSNINSLRFISSGSNNWLDERTIYELFSKSQFLIYTLLVKMVENYTKFTQRILAHTKLIIDFGEEAAAQNKSTPERNQFGS